MESITAAANPSPLCEPKRSKLRYKEAKVAQRSKPRERNRFKYRINNFSLFISQCERNSFVFFLSFLNIEEAKKKSKFTNLIR